MDVAEPFKTITMFLGWGREPWEYYGEKITKFCWLNHRLKISTKPIWKWVSVYHFTVLEMSLLRRYIKGFRRGIFA